MPIDAETIRSRILTALPDAEVAVRDSTGTGDHYQAIVVSPTFTGRMLIDRHRMVYAALGEAMKGDIHALALETLTPAERDVREGQQDRKDSRP
jgi:stress-induced morphogen